MLSDPQLRVLCVDDDEDSRELLIIFLGMANIEVVTAETAEQALALIETENFNLYVLDAWLPGIDGFELCRRIRAFDGDTPILFFSGAAYNSDRKRGIEAGAGAYLIKPDLNGLVESIRQLVSNATKPNAKSMTATMNTGTAGTVPSGASGRTVSGNTISEAVTASRGDSFSNGTAAGYVDGLEHRSELHNSES